MPATAARTYSTPSRRSVLAVGTSLLVAFALFGALGTTSASAGERQARLLVKFRPGTSAHLVDRELQRVGAQPAGGIPQLGIKLVSVPDSRLADARRRLRAANAVEFAELDATAEVFDTVPNDPWWPNQWSQVKVRAPQAWDVTTGNSGVVVAVLDTGAAPTQPDLQGAFVGGWNTLSGNSNTTDADGHGTLAAGVAVARGNNAIGLASYCWRCSLMPVKVLDTGAGTVATVSNGIVWATDHGARVVSMSLGFSSSSTTLQNAVRYAHDRNVVVVAAAGNYGTTAPVYPAAYAEVLGVAGSDGNDQLYSWSSYGSSVKLAAPGCNFSTGASGGYGTFCGTSSAAPALAGIVGLLASFAPASSNTKLEQAVLSSAVTIAGVQYGRVDAYAALLALGAGAAAQPLAPVSLTPPTVAGVAAVGSTLSGSAGTWSGTAPIGYTYQWSRCNASGNACADVAGATGTTYGVASADAGSTLRVAVRGSNASGSALAVSAPTAAVPVESSAPATATASFSGSLNKKQSSRSFRMTVGPGQVTATLAFGKLSTLTLRVTAVTGAEVATAAGPSVLRLVETLPAGTYDFTVAGAGGNDSFALTVTYTP